MRDLSWNYFRNTGDIDAYLLYKTYEQVMGQEVTLEEEEELGYTSLEH